MKYLISYFYAVFTTLSIFTLLGCSSYSELKANFTLHPLFPTAVNQSVQFDAGIMTTPLLDTSQGKPLVIVVTADGVIAALDAETGTLNWQLNAPAPEGERAELMATPVIIGTKLVISYQCANKGVHSSHRLAVIDLLKKQLDANFPVLTLTAQKPEARGTGIVSFDSRTAFSRTALKYTKKSGTTLGYVYVGLGAAQDTQPFHGWLFEIDMDAWQASKHNPQKTAIANVLLTTPEAQCPLKITYGGTQEMICGGGIWSPAGLQIYHTATDYELIVPTGNGQIDLARKDYANTLMRVSSGLNFDPACDAELCKNFNPLSPSVACMASCKNLFIPRLAQGDKPLKPASGECDDKNYWECLAYMDYDLGASSPIKVDLNDEQSVLIQAGKDGGVFLIDAQHLGTQYDHLQLVDNCGTKTDPCHLNWAGMIVTQPVQATIDDEPVVVIPTFVADKSHTAGLMALKIVLDNGIPKFKRFWQFPKADSPEATRLFRSHPSLPLLTTLDNEPIVWLVDIDSHGTLYGVRVSDGVMVAKQLLQGTGRPLTSPLIYNNTLYLSSTLPKTGKAMIEAFTIR
jgi:hypothetical protein